ncbi:MAG: formylglycine-generating enzyme family protein [Candidatus Electrothrix sp. AS4_5]|nr:formylglycine-generating enzyme family protein [Candidatus Electrothrix gigas]
MMKTRSSLSLSLFLIRVLLLSALLLAPATHAAGSTNFTNSIGMEFTRIPAGTFFMGSCMYSEADKKRDEQLKKQGLPAQGPTCPAQDQNEVNRRTRTVHAPSRNSVAAVPAPVPNRRERAEENEWPGIQVDTNALEEEAPQHLVKISKGFQIGTYEVTFGQFKHFLDALPAQKRNRIETEIFKQANQHGDNAAVAAVSWYNAQAFLRWLNQKEGGRQKYRLPTEAEWEYAARAGSKTIYFWGDNVEDAPKYAWFNMELADLEMWFPEEEFRKKENFSHPVGLKKPNAWGLYDIAGNVWEWVNDGYSATYYQNSPNPKVDPTGPNIKRLRCFRGGSWYGSTTNLRSAFRGLNTPDYHSNSLGFRVVREEY